MENSIMAENEPAWAEIQQRAGESLPFIGQHHYLGGDGRVYLHKAQLLNISQRIVTENVFDVQEKSLSHLMAHLKDLSEKRGTPYQEAQNPQAQSGLQMSALVKDALRRLGMVKK